jgi:hypothetical protein
MDGDSKIDTTTKNAMVFPHNHKFLALVPRGLQHVITERVMEASASAKLCTMNEPVDDNHNHNLGQRAVQALREQKQKKKKAKVPLANPWYRHSVGTISTSTSSSTSTSTSTSSSSSSTPKSKNKNQHVSVGYTPQQSVTWSVGGQLSGSVWLQIDTPAVVSVASLRCLGPLLALVTCSDTLPPLNHNHNHDPTTAQSLEQVTHTISEWILSNRSAYTHQLESALNLWKTYVQVSWKRRLSEEDYASLQGRIQANDLRFRMSCIREDTDVHNYSRQDLLKSIMESPCVKTILPHYHHNRPSAGGGSWKVNLTQFDVEVVLVILSSGVVAWGISLMPYAFCSATSFACGGVPPDITPPYLGGDVLSGLVRLKPTTAHLLLHMAQVEPFEVVLDPCAGIGTIPLEADAYRKSCIGLGGDVVLNHPTIASAAGALEQAARKGPPASSLLAAWDAAHLPIRTSSVDAVVSDLPFGQKCLSANALNQLLPLIFLECARVLVPGQGRMVLLSGSTTATTKALDECQSYWVQPCSMVTPVTIGGLLAWIVRVERSQVPYDASQHTRRLQRVRKLAEKRDRTAHHETATGGTSKKKRIQS